MISKNLSILSCLILILQSVPFSALPMVLHFMLNMLSNLEHNHSFSSFVNDSEHNTIDLCSFGLSFLYEHVPSPRNQWSRETEVRERSLGIVFSEDGYHLS